MIPATTDIWQQVFEQAVAVFGLAGVVSLAALGVFTYVAMRFLKTVKVFVDESKANGERMAQSNAALAQTNEICLTNFQRIGETHAAQTEVLRALAASLQALSEEVRTNDRALLQELITIGQALSARRRRSV